MGVPLRRCGWVGGGQCSGMEARWWRPDGVQEAGSRGSVALQAWPAHTSRALTKTHPPSWGRRGGVRPWRRCPGRRAPAACPARARHVSACHKAARLGRALPACWSACSSCSRRRCSGTHVDDKPAQLAPGRRAAVPMLAERGRVVRGGGASERHEGDKRIHAPPRTHLVGADVKLEALQGAALRALPHHQAAQCHLRGCTVPAGPARRQGQQGARAGSAPGPAAGCMGTSGLTRRPQPQRRHQATSGTQQVQAPAGCPRCSHCQSRRWRRCSCPAVCCRRRWR